MAATPIIDQSQLNDALNIFGRQKVCATVAQVFQSVRAEMDILDDPDTALDPIRSADRVHRSLGPAGIIGAKALHQAMSELEVVLRTAPQTVDAEDVDTILALVAETEFEFQSRMERTSRFAFWS